MNEYIKGLRNKQKEAYNEAMGLRDQLASGETLDDVKEVKAKFDRAMKAYDGFEEDIQREVKIQAVDASRLEHIDKARQENPKTDPEKRDEVERQLFEYNIRYGANPNKYPDEARKYVETHKDVYNAREKEVRTQNVTTDGDGGYLVPDSWYNEVNVAMGYMGPMLNRDLVTWITTGPSGGTMYFQKTDDTANSAFLVTESTSLATSSTDVAFTQSSLDAYKIQSSMLRVTNELIADANVNILDHLRELLATRMARGLNTYFTTGTGSSQPQGFAETAAAAGFSTKGEDFGARAITKTDLLNLYHSIDPYYRTKPSAGWQFTDTTLAVLRALDVSTDGGLIWQPSFATGGPATILGAKYYLNANLQDIQPTYRPIFFGDWKQYFVRETAPQVLKVSKEAYFINDQTAIALLGRWDGDVAGYADGVKFGRCATT